MIEWSKPNQIGKENLSLLLSLETLLSVKSDVKGKSTPFLDSVFARDRDVWGSNAVVGLAHVAS